MGRLFAAAAAIVIIIGAIGIPMGKLWATRQSEVAVVAPQPQPRATTPSAPPVREKRVEPVAAAAPEVTTVSAPIVENVIAAPHVSNDSSSAVAKPKTPVVANAARPPVRVQTPGVAPAGSAVMAVTAAAEAIPVSSAPILPPPAPEPVATPAAEAPQPVGPFFEMMQVDKAPRVATRVEPQWPASSGPKVTDIALVRVLVSQAGHPVLVRMLRPSKGGIAYDDAVIAAVKKWTFTPAVKKGDAVTCWLHVAVPLNGGK
jgi:protein TonB